MKYDRLRMVVAPRPGVGKHGHLRSYRPRHCSCLACQARATNSPHVVETAALQ